MIFLSHNKNDKPVVENIAIRLRDVFGHENIFYDSWSIQPGEGLIDKIDEGLSRCKFFFFFVSENSLQSNMVKLEWQNALMKATNHQLKFIPVRMDRASMPAIFTQTLYIDLFSSGLEDTLKQMIKVVRGESTFQPQHPHFSNLQATCRYEDQKLTITVKATYSIEVVPRIAVMLTNPIGSVTVRMLNAMIQQSGTGPGRLADGRFGNLWAITMPLPITPGFPVEFEVQSNGGAGIGFVDVLAETRTNNWLPIPRYNI